MADTSGSYSAASACRICGDPSMEHLDAREMMFGLREHFSYSECLECGCVQISDYPGNIEKYYPPDYAAHDDGDRAGSAPYEARFVAVLKRRLLGRSGMPRSFFLRSRSTRRWLESRPVMALYLTHVPDPKKRILDVGCGTGLHLRNLLSLHYQNVNGVDPFITKDVHFEQRLLVRKARLADLGPSYDCISFHHVLEHMPDQLGVLKQTHGLLAEDGVLIIRIPVVGGAAWRTYRQNWVQLDPPRHYYLHSETSFRMLADAAGFDIKSIEYDSFGFQFWGSELYIRDIPLSDPRSPFRSKSSIFPPDVLADYEARSVELNQSRDGDQVVAILRKKALRE